MIEVGVTWGDTVWAEFYCDCAKCAKEINFIKVYGETFTECAAIARSAKWIVDRPSKTCYAPHHQPA